MNLWPLMSPAIIDTGNAPTNHWLKKTGKEAGARLKFQGSGISKTSLRSTKLGNKRKKGMNSGKFQLLEAITSMDELQEDLTERDMDVLLEMGIDLRFEGGT